MKDSTGTTQKTQEVEEGRDKEKKAKTGSVSVSDELNQDISQWMQFMTRGEDGRKVRPPCRSSADDLWYGFFVECVQKKN